MEPSRARRKKPLEFTSTRVGAAITALIVALYLGRLVFDVTTGPHRESVLSKPVPFVYGPFSPLGEAPWTLWSNLAFHLLVLLIAIKVAFESRSRDEKVLVSGLAGGLSINSLSTFWPQSEFVLRGLGLLMVISAFVASLLILTDRLRPAKHISE